jgi:hypothetical protein
MSVKARRGQRARVARWSTLLVCGAGFGHLTIHAQPDELSLIDEARPQALDEGREGCDMFGGHCDGWGWSSGTEYFGSAIEQAQAGIK